MTPRRLVGDPAAGCLLHVPLKNGTGRHLRDTPVILLGATLSVGREPTGKAGQRERIRQDGRTFFQECLACRTRTVFFVDPVVL